MLFQNKHVFCVVMTLAFSSCFSSFPDYVFQVNPVKKCPMNKEAWDISSARMNCNKTHGYHCVPNKILTSLIEFCYPRGEKIPFEKGNCLELAGTGILNHVSCKNTFSSGCPDSFYFGNEIYKYPKCLAINTTLRCFDSDTQCIGSRLMKQNATRQNSNNEQNRTAEQSGNLTTKYSSEGSTVQNIINEWNITGDQSGNLTQMILNNSTVLVEQSSVERIGTGKQTDSSFTKNSSENSPVLVTILSILLSVSIFVLIVVSLKRNKYLMTCTKGKSRRNSIPGENKQRTDTMSISEITSERYERSPRVSDEITYREANSVYEEGSNPIDPQSLSTEIDGQALLVKENETRSSACSSLVRERESSTRNTLQTVSSQSIEETESDFTYEDVNFDSKRIEKDTFEEYLEPIYAFKRSSNRCNHVSEEETYGSKEIEEQCHECDLFDNQEGSYKNDPQLFPSQFNVQMDPECDYDDCSSECCLLHNEERSNQTGPQLFSLHFHGQIDRGCEYEENSLENKSGSNVLNEVETNFSECYDYVVNPQIPANEKAAHSYQLEYSNIDNQTCSSIDISSVFSRSLEQGNKIHYLKKKNSSDKLRIVVRNKEKRKPVVVITEKESKQTKEVATSERTKSITSSHSTKKSEEKKRAVLSSDKNKERKKREQMRPRKHRMREIEWRRRWENEQENKRQMDVYMKQKDKSIRLAREIEKLRRERDQLEKEKLEWQCLEKFRREQLEREKLEREQEEKRRLEQLRWEAEQKRITMKRLYSSRGDRDEFWIKAKRPVVTENRFTSKATFSSDRLYDDSRDKDQVMDCRGTMDNFSRDSRPEKRSTLGIEREKDRSSTRYDWIDSYQHERSDRRDERDRDRRGARTLLRDSRHEWKSERENGVMETSFSGDSWQGGGNSSSLPNEINMSQIGITSNSGPGLFNSSSNSQRNWASSADRSNTESSWSAPIIKENRILGFQPQDRWTWNNLGLQADTWQQAFGTQMTSGHSETRGPVMFPVSVPQPVGMVQTNTSLARGQTEPRFDAYNSMQTQFRRY